MEKQSVGKERIGTVLSTAMDKTAVVSIERHVKHGLYGKIVKKNKNIMIHDEDNQCSPGDVIRAIETRPLSRRKRWTLDKIISKAK